ncbi:DAK2 domain-containing protein [Antrihabitans cavernicola]|uniref:DAK2 domain-containing protein n=1 Tax=Antrihabitans cavernicola TaxID=2495913 RepID=A0A5A7SDL9_9NOCA|nr:DAK2 domain-containing protein [Spelaeibacter cavernicola]KAA0024248.1 DAK2 domain-containing protein [Spelaeibacter cavernicola]
MLEVLEAVDGDALQRWGQACVDRLTLRCDEINNLNVFPIPDSDTGTNLLFTMRAAMDSVTRNTGDSASAHEVAMAMSRGATTGARGNSGIILSQVMRGLAVSSADGPFTAATLRASLELAAGLVRNAVSVPVEGTIMTVLDCAAYAAGRCAEDASISEVARAAADAAAEALAATTDQLDVLRDAGVVDAGGLGLVVMLDVLVGVISGREPERTFARSEPSRDVRPTPTLASEQYEVMYLVADSDDERIAELRTRLGAIGDSVIIVGDGDGGWSVHVHCADAGAAVEAGLTAGALSRVRINCFALDAASHQVVEVTHSGIADRAILAVAEGDGAAALFESEGVIVLRCDEPISAIQLLAAIRNVAHREVLVLPNGALSAHELVAVSVAARDANHEVVLLPSSSMVQALAAIAVHDPQRIAVDDAFAMSECASATRWGSLRIADERALTLVGTCEPGDGLGLIGREVVVIEKDAEYAGTQLLDRVLGSGGELVTMLVGGNAPTELIDHLASHVAQHHPGVDVMIYPGGQLGDLVQLGVE